MALSQREYDQLAREAMHQRRPQSEHRREDQQEKYFDDGTDGEEEFEGGALSAGALGYRGSALSGGAETGGFIGERAYVREHFKPFRKARPKMPIREVRSLYRQGPLREYAEENGLYLHQPTIGQLGAQEYIRNMPQAERLENLAKAAFTRAYRKGMSMGRRKADKKYVAAMKRLRKAGHDWEDIEAMIGERPESPGGLTENDAPDFVLDWLERQAAGIKAPKKKSRRIKIRVRDE